MMPLSISENILLFLSGFGIVQGVLLAAILYFHPKTDRSVTTFLALYIFCISIPIMMPVGHKLLTWQLIIFVEPFTLLIGPLLYFYMRGFKERITWQKAWPHLILFVVYIFIAFWIYAAIGSKYPPSGKLPPEVTQHPLTIIPVSIRLLQRLVYYFLSRRELLSYQRSIRHLFSDISRINGSWMRWLINGYLVLVLATMVCYALVLNFPDDFSLWVLLLGTLVTIYIYMAAWRGISQPTLWQLQPGLDKEKIEQDMQEAGSLPLVPVNGEKTKTLKTGLSDDKTREMVHKIIAAMEKEKLYKETELTLRDLAEKLQYPSYQVSQGLNEGLGKNFYDLVNGYRVEEAKRLLVDPRNTNYTILAVGFEAGFNSKTTFNTVFKKMTGFTPTDFRERQRAAALAEV
jgi:AraC-like DNA-binding protein/uncharacterized membrane protein YwzB